MMPGVFLIGNTPDHQASGVGPLLVVIFLALLVASFWIAWRNWQADLGLSADIVRCLQCGALTPSQS
jgi:hypothetical protein